MNKDLFFTRRGSAIVGVIFLILGIIAAGGLAYVKIRQIVSEKLSSSTAPVAQIPEQPIAKNCGIIENTRDRNVCYANQAESLKDGSICEKIGFYSLRESCYLRAAIATKDSSLCTKFGESGDYQNQRECAIAIAKQGNPSVCELRGLFGSNKSQCFGAAAVAKKDLSLCDKTQGFYRDYCYSQVAREKKDYSVCDKFTNSQAKISCYTTVAPAIQDLSLCDKILSINQKDFDPTQAQIACYRAVAAAKKDRSICDNLPKGGLHQIKMGLPQINLDSQKTNLDTQECYVGIALSAKDAGICSVLPKQEDKDFCYDAFISRTPSNETIDASVCDHVRSEVGRAACYGKVALNNQDVSFCEKTVLAGVLSFPGVTPEIAKYFCYSGVAATNGDKKICEMIPRQNALEQRYSDSCYSGIVPLAEDPKLCEEIKTQDSKDDCYEKYGSETEDASFCQKIEKMGLKNACYADIAKKTKDISLCANVRDVGCTGACVPEYSYSSSKESCYFEVAVAKLDSSICDNISTQASRDSCERRVAEQGLLVENNPAFCEKIKNIDARDACYIKVVENTKDVAFCSKVQSDKTPCFLTGTVNRCTPGEKSVSNKTQCYTNVARDKNDIAVCNNIQTRYEKALCLDRASLSINEIAREKNDVSLCKQFDQDNYGFDCYAGVAVVNKDPSVCNYIKSQADSTLCRDAVSQQKGLITKPHNLPEP